MSSVGHYFTTCNSTCLHYLLLAGDHYLRSFFDNLFLSYSTLRIHLDFIFYNFTTSHQSNCYQCGSTYYYSLHFVCLIMVSISVTSFLNSWQWLFRAFLWFQWPLLKVFQGCSIRSTAKPKLFNIVHKGRVCWLLIRFHF